LFHIQHYSVKLNVKKNGDLAGRIKAIKNAGKQFEISQIFAWSIQASTALKYLHIEKKIAHRDIKPGYIYMH
jgi:serine/threonine protein kinase